MARPPATPVPASVACTAKRSYPSRSISSAKAPATRNRLPHPSVAGVEKPYPGSDGITTSKAWAGSPPWLRGSVSGPMTRRNSTGELGQPWIMSSGVASGSGERTWTKWTVWPSNSVVNCGTALSVASWARQSNPSAQYAASSRR